MTLDKKRFGPKAALSLTSGALISNRHVDASGCDYGIPALNDAVHILSTCVQRGLGEAYVPGHV